MIPLQELLDDLLTIVERQAIPLPLARVLEQHSRNGIDFVLEYWYGGCTIWRTKEWQDYVACDKNLACYWEWKHGKQEQQTTKRVSTVNQRIKKLEQSGDVFGSALLKGLFKDL